MKLKHIFIIIALIVSCNAFSQEYVTLSGTITNVSTGKALNGIDIVVKDKITGTVSNYKGAYILYLDKGSYEISFSAPGYIAEDIKVELNDDQVQMVELTPKGKQEKKYRKLNRKINSPKSANKEILSANNL